MIEKTPRALTIGILTYDYDPPIGGLGVMVSTYKNALQKQFPEHRYEVIAPTENADIQVPWLAKLRAGKSVGCPTFSLIISFWIHSLVSRKSLDVLHVHAGSGGVFLLRRPGCPLVVTAHHTYSQEARLVFTGLKSLVKRFMSYFEARTYRMADAIICVSADTADELKTYYGIPAKKITVIENPVHLEFPPGPRVQDEHTLLYVGRLEQRKGIRILLDAFEILAREIPELRLRLIGSDLMGTRSPFSFRNASLDARVSYLGYVHDAYRLREMASATVLVVPSVLEGFGLVAAESMALGTCVVCSDAPGLRSVVKDGETGLHFESGNTEDCVRTLRIALTDAALRRRLEEQALTDARERFDLARRTKDVQMLLDSVCAGK